MEALRVSHGEELERIKQAAAEQVVVAEARGRRAGLIEKEVAEAQLAAAARALAEEKEVVHKHRLSADLLAGLSDKVRHGTQLGLGQTPVVVIERGRCNAGLQGEGSCWSRGAAAELARL